MSREASWPTELLSHHRLNNLSTNITCRVLYVPLRVGRTTPSTRTTMRG